MSTVISSAHESHADHTVTSHRVCSSVAGCFTGLRRECCSETNHQLRFQLKHRRKPQEGDLKDDTLFTGQSGNHRPSQLQLISTTPALSGPFCLLTQSPEPSCWQAEVKWCWPGCCSTPLAASRLNVEADLLHWVTFHLLTCYGGAQQ